MSRPDGERCPVFFSCTVVGPHHTHVNEIGAAWCGDEPARIDYAPAAPAADPLRPRPAEPTVEGRLAELDALRATVARVEALRVEWETSEVRLSRRFAANELLKALRGES